MKTPLVIDIETDGGNPWDGELLCASWDWNGFQTTARETPPLVLKMLANPSIPKVAHSKYDFRWYALTGHTIDGPLYDTMKMAHTLNENHPLNLEFLAQHYCGITMDKRLTHGKVVKFRCDDGTLVPITEAPDDQLFAYCNRDVETTLQLFYKLWDELDRRMLLDYYLEEEVPFTRVLLEMEVAGMPIDIEEAGKLKERLQSDKYKLESELEESLGYYVNLNSPDKLKKVLYEDVWYETEKLPIDAGLRTLWRKGELDAVHQAMPTGFELEKVGLKYATGTWYRRGLGLKPLKKKTTDKNGKTKWVITTESPSLLMNYSEHEWVSKLLQWRKLDKVISTYLETYPDHYKDGRIYGTFDQSGTVTHRLSSREPNLQNQPAHGPLGLAIRNLFKGRLIVGDHSQLEPRVMAHFSGDPVLLDVYRNDRDLYLTTASFIFGRVVEKDEEERQLCKTLILALGYGAYEDKLAQILTINGFPTKPDKAGEYLRYLEDLYSGFFGWKEHAIAEAKYKGYVKTIGGHYRRLNYAFGDAAWKVQNKGERQAVNSIIQGSAADILRRNMLDCRNLSDTITLLAQVHDELIWERLFVGVPEHYILNALKGTCEAPGYTLDVPLKFEPAFCNTWAEKGGKGVVIEDD